MPKQAITIEYYCHIYVWNTDQHLYTESVFSRYPYNSEANTTQYIYIIHTHTHTYTHIHISDVEWHPKNLLIFWNNEINHTIIWYFIQWNKKYCRVKWIYYISIEITIILNDIKRSENSNSFISIWITKAWLLK